MKHEFHIHFPNRNLLIFSAFASLKSHVMNAHETGRDPLCPFNFIPMLSQVQPLEILTNSLKSNTVFIFLCEWIKQDLTVLCPNAV